MIGAGEESLRKGLETGPGSEQCGEEDKVKRVESEREGNTVPHLKSCL